MAHRSEIDQDTLRQSETATLIVSAEGRVIFLNAPAQALYDLHPGGVLPHPLP